ncbi:MAG: hypothetical protein KDD69_09920 [Bdellovibrionales bacterium]|nr:hypothetical protein [Bdellovibrionales bacterium]
MSDVPPLRVQSASRGPAKARDLERDSMDALRRMQADDVDPPSTAFLIFVEVMKWGGLFFVLYVLLRFLLSAAS